VDVATVGGLSRAPRVRRKNASLAVVTKGSERSRMLRDGVARARRGGSGRVSALGRKPVAVSGRAGSERRRGWDSGRCGE
jgi:hypothetical protein